jgi:hypothetical protein
MTVGMIEVQDERSQLAEDDFCKLPIAQFWPKMAAAKRVHPIDQNGKVRGLRRRADAGAGEYAWPES